MSCIITDISEPNVIVVENISFNQVQCLQQISILRVLTYYRNGYFKIFLDFQKEEYHLETNIESYIKLQVTFQPYILLYRLEVLSIYHLLPTYTTNDSPENQFYCWFCCSYMFIHFLPEGVQTCQIDVRDVKSHYLCMKQENFCYHDVFIIELSSLYT